MKVDRRSFFSRIFGGVAAIAVAPHINTTPRLKASPLKRAFLSSTGKLGLMVSNPGAQLYTKFPPPEFEMGEIMVCEGIEQIPESELTDPPEFLGTKNSSQDGLGVTFHDLPAGCPIGYY